MNEQYYKSIMKCVERYTKMANEHNETELVRFLQGFNEDVPLEKLNRWLGYVQGVLITEGYTTVATERDWTRPLFRPLDFPEPNMSTHSETAMSLDPAWELCKIVDDLRLQVQDLKDFKQQLESNPVFKEAWLKHVHGTTEQLKQQDQAKTMESVLSQWPCNCHTGYTIEPHGKPGQYVIYLDRCNHLHGANLGYITEPDMPAIKAMLQCANSQLKKGVQ